MVYKCIFRNIKMGGAIFAGYLSSSVFMYIFCMLLGIYKFSSYFLIYGGILSFVCLTAYFFIYRKITLKEFFSPSVVMALFFTILLGLTLSGQILAFHDEYSHWAKAVRELYLFDKSFINPDTSLEHYDYVPALTYLSYAAVKALGFSNTLIYISSDLCMILGLAWLTENFKWKNKFIMHFSTGAIMTFLPLLGTSYSFCCLLIDLPMGALFGICLTKIFAERKSLNHTWFILLLAVYQLTVMKLFSGLLFSAIIALAYFLKNRHFIFSKNKIRSVKYLIKSCCLLLCIFIVHISFTGFFNYKNEIKIYETQKLENQYLGLVGDDTVEKPVFSLSMLFKQNDRSGGTAEILKDTDNPENIKIGREYKKQWLEDKLAGSMWNIFTIPVLICILLAVYIVHIFISSKTVRTDAFIVLFLWFVSAVIYSAGTYIAYITWMGSVTEVTRYSGVYIIALVILTVTFTARKLNDNIPHRKLIRSCLVILILINIINIVPYRYMGIFYNPIIHNVPEVKQDISSVSDITDTGDRILSFKNADSLDYKAYGYYALPYYNKTLETDHSDSDILSLIKEYRITKIIIYDKYVEDSFWDEHKSIFHITQKQDIYCFSVIIKNHEPVIVLI